MTSRISRSTGSERIRRYALPCSKTSLPQMPSGLIRQRTKTTVSKTALGMLAADRRHGVIDCGVYLVFAVVCRLSLLADRRKGVVEPLEPSGAGCGLRRLEWLDVQFAVHQRHLQDSVGFEAKPAPKSCRDRDL